MKFTTVPGRFAICKLGAASAIPGWAATKPVFSITATPDELSIICLEASVPDGIQAERGFLALQIEGPFAFDAIGILQSFLAPLAKASVPMFAVSTYDTDYIFIHEKHWPQALRALQQAGHELQQGQSSKN
jgi:hypothetical protein